MTVRAQLGQSVQEHLDEYWTTRARDYDAYQLEQRRWDDNWAVWSRVWREALGPEPLDVLDVGTGSGYVARVIAGLPEGHRVVGVDLSDGMLEIAREHAVEDGNGDRLRFEPGDAVDPPLPAGSVDAVVSRYLMWTLREPVEAARRWRRLLRPGGLVAAVDGLWHTGAMGRTYPDDVQDALPLADATSIEQTAQVLRDAGLREVSITPLTEVFELDRRYGVAPGHELVQQYLITGRL